MLSIIVASHNDEQYITDTLNAVIDVHNELDIDTECIIVDRSSTDKTQQICRGYCENHPFIKLITEQSNDNVLATAFNTGMNVMKGDYVLFLEAGYIPYINFIQPALKWLMEDCNGHAVTINRLYNLYEPDKSYKIIEQYWNPDVQFGPELSGCVFNTKYLCGSKFDNIPASSEVFAMNIILYSFNYTHNYIWVMDGEVTGFGKLRESHDYEFNRKQSIIYSDFPHLHVQHLQYLPPTYGYRYCLDDNDVCVTRGERPIWNMDYHVIDRCNLNCKYCNHLCPIVPSNTPPKTLYEIFTDFEKISRFKDMMANFTILGGEPLLHPDIGIILKKVRELMPNNSISLTTNGTMFKRLEELAPIIQENNIYVTLSLYPVSNTEEIENAFKKYIPCTKMHIVRIPTDEGFAKRLLQEDEQKDIDRIYGCPRRRGCCQFANGRIYICHYSAALHYLKEKFGDQVKIEDNGFLEITENTKSGDIIKFLYNDIPDVCRHCNDVSMFNPVNGFYNFDYEPWTTSTKELEEFYKHN